MDSDGNRIKAKVKALEAAGIGPEQVDLAVRTSASLATILENTPMDRDGLSMKEVYTEFAGSTGPGRTTPL